MKKRVLVFVFRLAIATAIAVTVASAQYLLWQTYGHSGSKPDESSFSIKGFSYSGYRLGQSPFTGPHPSTTELASDLDLLRQETDSLRTYGISELPTLLSLASARDFQVTAGIWIDDNEDKNQREIHALIEAANEIRHVERCIVGNEFLYRADNKGKGAQAFEQLTAYLQQVRASVRKPVSTAEQWHIWKKYPELAEHVDFITVHIFPYHEGIGIDDAVRQAFAFYDNMVKLFPGKKIVIGEIGWPSKGPVREAAEPSDENQARFVREFLSDPRTPMLDYFLLEAIDQPWKIDVDMGEGWAGAYWGMYDANRKPKYPLTGPIERDRHWPAKASHAAIVAFLPMLLAAFFLPGWSIGGRLFLATMIQACVSTLVIGLNVPVEYYLVPQRQQRELIGLALIIGATCLTIAVLLSHGFEFGEILFKRRWQRRFMPLPPHAAGEQPFVSIHLACYNEPPEMVIATLDSLAALEYDGFEVLVLDNNTRDESLWRPLEKRCAELGPRFRFFHLMNWPGFKAGALNYGLKVTDPRAEVVGVVDADYVVDPQWLAVLVPHFDKGDVAVVQAPQAHRDWENQAFRRMCNWEFDGFFRIGMHHRNERNALIQHGTMTLVRRLALEEVGGWSEWCICEDTELGLRLIEKGYDTRYVDRVLGRGLTPSDFAAIKSQRFRWAFGAMQILKAHLPKMLGPGTLNFAQRYHFLTGWFAWFGDALQLVFAYGSLLWTIGILAHPKAFSLPVVALALPVLGFMAFKAALGPILYRRTMACPWRDIFGASILSVGLSHAIARGVFTGLAKKKGVFVVTPKGWKAKGALAFFGPVREELGMLVALILAIMALVWTRGVGDSETQLWIGILALQCIPYTASIACQIAAYLPERRACLPASKPASRTPESRVAPDAVNPS
ncbi:MAG: glycosyltransferase [Azoarcus sp.]|jgi:exo-beta-1,3-glucanase (GH17 family)/cellulose synthase/poly-beta-1,6-N-acetylglucosamine synthase-like glycosyltransferase|nr:glycosyltransferase [Azoarcus sp.]